MKQKIEKLVEKALVSAGIEQVVEENNVNIKVERPNNEDHGHFSTNIAMQLPQYLKKSPREIGQNIVDNMTLESGLIEKVTIAGPGFINFHLTDQALQSVVNEIQATKENFGKSKQGQGKKAIVEFVSANPTGPLNIGHGRQAVLGDTIARILEWNGYNVQREYYYNDAGKQMRLLGLSTYTRYMQLLGHDLELEENYYQGEYIKEVAQSIVDEYGDEYEGQKEADIFREYAEKFVFEDIERTLEELDIEFDQYYNEKNLYEEGKVESVLNRLEEKGASYEKNGAIWFKGTDYGTEQDRVLWKSVADEATYRLPDIAYHETKFERNFDRIVDIFGADHHATVPDVLAGLRALDYDAEQVEVVLHQFVTLMKGDQKVKMSTRKANYVTLDDLMEEVGRDVVRYFFIMRNAESQLNFDLELAREEGEENPVFYLQYAHARICSLLDKAEDRGVDLAKQGDVSLLKAEETLDLAYVLSEFKEVVNQCGQTLEPQHIPRYLGELASAFHKFYTECRVLSDDEDLTYARLEIVKTVKQVLANGLNLIGVNAPEKM